MQAFLTGTKERHPSNAHTHVLFPPHQRLPSVSLQRKGHRQHLVQALAEAASGPLPLSALLPILRAKETGPGATDLALEVLEMVTTEEGNGASNDASTKAVIGKNTGIVRDAVPCWDTAV